MLCIHFGPGRLGLGLIVEQLDEAGFSVCLIGSPGCVDDLSQFGVAFTDPNRGLEYRDVHWHSIAAAVEDLPPEVLDIVSSTEPVLITAALGEKIADRSDFIVELVSRRETGAETVLLACENDPHPAYKQVANRCGSALSVHPCVVDRICAWPTTVSIDEQGRKRLISHPTDHLGRRVVSAHPVGAWVISTRGSQAATLELLAALAAASTVQLTPEEITGHKAQKLWSVNGIHIVLALIARREEIDLLPLERTHETTFCELAEPLMRQIAAGVAWHWPDTPPNNTYVPEHMKAFTESPDSTARILERFLVRDNLQPFMERLDRRLGDAARAAHAAGQDCEPFYEAMALVVSVLSDYTLYYPHDGRALDQEIDKAALCLFSKVIEGWLDEQRAADLMAALRRSLRGHHALAKPLRRS